MERTLTSALALVAAILLGGCGNPVPVKVVTRESFVGEGLVAQLHNEAPNRLVVNVVLENEALGHRKEGHVALAPNSVYEIGWVEGWRFERGETITISHSDYRSMTYTIR